MPKRSAQLPAWISAVAVGGTFAALVLLELRSPLRRKQTEPKLRRNIRNMAVAATAAAAIQLCDAPVTKPLVRVVERRRWGMVNWLRLPRWLEIPLSLLLLDYTLYLWHVAFHKVPALWRLHQVHHVDLDMDTSTAIRFHFGEMVLSVILRTAQILLIGVSRFTFSIWNTWLLCEVMFHHSNVQLPCRVERWLSRVVVTPRMHGIHHSIVPEELNSNWSSGLTLWDYLHGTLRLNVPQEQITIGVAAYRDPHEVTYPKLMTMPFVQEQRDPAALPESDLVPARSPDRLPDPRPTHMQP
jgi:sterol desaturase/sphingolipid hydroxylase (fatty acid hydroxylase superfamily)